jgi:sugar phosphate isomerase/epimerase
MKEKPKPSISRREFVQGVAGAAAFTAVSGATWPLHAGLDEPLFKISLAHWSYHKAIFGNSRDDYEWYKRTLASDPDGVLLGPMDHRDIVVKAREHGIDAVDYVNVFFLAHVSDSAYLADMKRRGDAEGVKANLITCDELGRIGDADAARRAQAVENHVRWVEAAALLGCQSIRVNAVGDGTYLAQLERTADGLNALCEEADAIGLDILVENHGESSNNGAWLAMVVQSVDHPRLGVLADFGNWFMGGWNVDPPRWYDRYQGLRDIAPYTRAVSAKSHGFDENGQELETDYEEAMRILLAAGFRGYVGAEYEGDQLSEHDGVAATKRLLEATREKLKLEFN